MLWDYFWLCVSAAVAGAVNALAGGGTLLTFPTLIGVLTPQFGLAAGVRANGTSTVALVPASLGSAWGFRRELYHLRRLIIWLLPPSLIGAFLGALLVTRLNPVYFDRLVPWLILGAAVLFTIQPLLMRRKKLAPIIDGAQAAPLPTSDLSDALTHIPARSLAGMMALQLAIAIYGGYFGAGIGILMLSGLGLMGLKNIHEMNGLKAVLGTAINAAAVIVFVYDSKVVWPFALAMMVTSTAGGYLAAHYGRRLPGKYVRWFVIFMGFSLASYYFWKRYAA